MSIWQKIKAWWTAYQEGRRAWWNEPVKRLMFTAFAENTQRIMQLHQEIHNLENLVREMRRMLGQRIDEVESKILDKHDEHRQHLGTVENDIGKDLKSLTEQISGIRSRYQWVEDRYNDMAKGKTPREFDYEHRQ